MRKFTYTQLAALGAAQLELQHLTDAVANGIGGLYPDNSRTTHYPNLNEDILALNGVIAQLTEAWEALQEMPTLGRPEDGETVELEVCVDCYMFDNGFSEHETGQPYPAAVLESFARISTDNGGALIEIIPSVAEDLDEDGNGLEGRNESHFSWSRCQQCLSNLGGDRHPVTLLVGSVHPAGI